MLPEGQGGMGDLGGRLEVFPLSSVLQLVAMTRQVGLLEVVTDDGGAVHIDDGHVVWAKSGHREGAEAVLALLGVHRGRFAFRHGAASRLAGAMHLDVSALLMERVRLEDEAERLAEHVPPPVARLKRVGQGAIDEPDVLGCGLAQVVAALEVESTFSGLLARVALCPLKVQLAVAHLIERGHLRGRTGVSSSSLKAVRPVEPSPLASALEARRGMARVLCVVGVESHPADLEASIKALARAIDADVPRVMLAGKGPVFLRLRPATGGLLSLTLLQLARANRVLFQSFSSSADVVMTPEGSEGPELSAWTACVSNSLPCVSYGERPQGGASLSARLLQALGGGLEVS